MVKTVYTKHGFGKTKSALMAGALWHSSMHYFSPSEEDREKKTSQKTTNAIMTSVVQNHTESKITSGLRNSTSHPLF